MSDHRSRAFQATTLTYRSPVVDTTTPVPTCFYNAFPDLNDKAPDDSQSAFPRRASYLFPLDSEFLPSGMWVHRKNVDKIRLESMVPLESMDPWVVQLIDAALIHKDGKVHPREELIVNLPRNRALHGRHHSEGLFEITHKRLATAEYKYTFRAYTLAPLYTALEEHLERGQTIEVPLVTDPGGSRLQRHWAAVDDAFRQSLLLDEAASLLISVILLPSEEGKAYEQAWVRQEEGENPGFAEFYWELRDKFPVEPGMTETDRQALAEQIFQYAKEQFSSFPGLVDFVARKVRDEFPLKSWTKTTAQVFLEQIFQYVEEKCPAEKVWRLPVLDDEFDLSSGRSTVSVRWPGLLGAEIHQGLPQLLVVSPFSLTRKIAQISIPEAVQWLITFSSITDFKHKSFTCKDSRWLQFVALSIEMGDDFSSPRITLPDVSSYLWTLPTIVGRGKHLKKPDGSTIDPDQDRALEDQLIVHYICCYTIFLESIRQQLCTGIGLRCPFWKGSGCCKFRPLLQRTYDVAKPWLPDWKHHWQRPPCLT